jgi:hypothetical protein
MNWSEKISEVLNRQLDEQELSEIQLWEKGRQLAQIVMLPGWQVALEMLQTYPMHALQDLAMTDPSAKDEIAINHSIAFVGNRILVRFQEDVAAAIEAAKQPPPAVKEAVTPQ